MLRRQVGASVWSLLGPFVAAATCSSCESGVAEQPQAADATEEVVRDFGDTTTAPFRVLVVGGGLTGSVTAALLRRRWKDRARELEIHVWERATYPAGRFGAVAKHGEATADLGAQVLSVVNPFDERAREGHGITMDALRQAFAEATSLKERGLLVEVNATPHPAARVCRADGHCMALVAGSS